LEAGDREKPEAAMASKKREWSAEIKVSGHPTLYAWVAYNAKFDTFATDKVEHARTFETREEVEGWITRLHIKNATPVRIRK
jgi:hypothetical protein